MTARSKNTDPVVVRQYGLRDPLDWDRDVTDELWRANQLWNRLVEIERENRARYEQILDSSDALREVAGRIAELHAEREELVAERNRRRAKARSKAHADTEDLEDRLNAIREALVPLYAERKKLSAQARKEMKPELDALEADRKEAVKSARQNSGMFWGNYNAVLDAFNVARVRAMKDGAQLRFKRFTGEGRLVNQIQGGMTVDQLFSGSHSQVQIRLNGERRGRPVGILRFKAFTERDANNRPSPRYVSFPIILHRPFPEGTVIKMVTVNVRRLAGRFRYTVTFTCRAPSTGEKPAGTGAAGINLGWKSVPGGLRVATAAFSDGSVEHLILPDRWVKDRSEYISRLQGQLDEAVNEILPRLKEALAPLPAWSEDVQVEGYPHHLHRRLCNLRKAPRVSAVFLLDLFWSLKLQWDKEPNSVPVLHEIADDLNEWRRKNKRIYRVMVNRMDKLLAARKNLYRVFAARVADRAGLVVVDDTNYTRIAKAKKAVASGEDPELEKVARAHRVLAAPFELRDSIEKTLTKRGGKFLKYDGKINVCHECGTPNNGKTTMITCAGCGVKYDIDENAAKNLLAVALS